MDPLQVCALHRTHDYDLILLDLQMPMMTASRSWWRCRPAQSTPTCR
jgi:CheY-like chemotaxis protein